MVDEKKMERLFSAVGMDMERYNTPIPSMPLFTQGVQEPPLLQGITIPALYAAAYECMVLRSILQHLTVETFRKGWDWDAKFVVKCTECGEEYQQQVEGCKACEGPVRKPDRGQIDYADAILKNGNRMTQNFVDVLREIEMDLNIVDDAYIILTKEYFVDPKSKTPQFFRVREVSRADPIFMRILSDKRGIRGGTQYTSLLDRSFRTSDPEGVCPISGMPVVPIHYINLAGVGNGQVYTEGEVVHISKLSPSKLYGRSPVATMWRQVNTLIAMDNYVYSAYQKRRMPRGVMVIKSSNMETVERTARNIPEHLERDPNYVPTIGVETESGRGGLEYVRMMDTEWTLTLSPHEEEDEIMQLRRDEMAIRNMMQMKQAGYEALLRDQIDDKYLNFDFREPSPEEIAQKQQAEMAAQGAKGGGGAPPVAPPVQKSEDVVE